MQPVTLKGVRTLFSDGAQEAEKVLPELVTEDSRNGYKAVRYNMLPLMTLQGMKEQQDQIKTLQAENSNLKARLCSISLKGPTRFTTGGHGVTGSDLHNVLISRYKIEK